MKNRKQLTRIALALIGLLVLVVIFGFVIIRKSPLLVATHEPNGMTSNGEWITFACGSEQEAEIYIMRPDGSEVKQVTHLGNWSIRPRWSPDGLWIVFLSAPQDRNALYGKGPVDIYKVQSNGSEVRQLTNDLVGQDAPTWSPDGEWIAFTSIYSDASDIYRMRPDGSQIQQLTHVGTAQYPIWFLDGESLSFASVDQHGDFEFYQMHPDGSNLRPWKLNLPSWQFSWSPVSDEIAFAYSPKRYGSNIYKASLKSILPRQLTDLPGVNSFPSWSPDGQWIVFGSDTGIKKVKSDGSQLTQLTSLNCGVASYPSWISFPQRPVQ